jgi:hypothetical protein
MTLYSPAVYIPPKMWTPKGKFMLAHTKHAIREAANDGVTLPAYLDTTVCRVFEVAVDGGRVVKMGFRLRYDHRDLCLVVAVESLPWRVVTVWTNEVGDDHASLDTSRYYRPDGHRKIH